MVSSAECLHLSQLFRAPQSEVQLPTQGEAALLAEQSGALAPSPGRQASSSLSTSTDWGAGTSILACLGRAWFMLAVLLY